MIARIASILFLLMAANPAAAEDTPDPGRIDWDLSGSARAGNFSGSRNLDDAGDTGTAALWLRAAPKVGEAHVVLEGWVRNDDVTRSGNETSRLREAYVDFSVGELDFRIGKQIIVWGRADELNPTDNLTPRDYTKLVPDSDDQRFGTSGVKLTEHFHDLALSAIWLPTFNSNVIPIAPSPGVSYASQARQINQIAFKLDQTGGAIDWSVSYFNGLNLNPDTMIGSISASGLNLVLKNNRIRVLGADAATTLGQYGLRAEAAYTWTSFYDTMDPLVTKPSFYAVLGADRNFGGDVNLNVQYYFRRVTGYQDPNGIASPLLRSLAIPEAVITNQYERVEDGLTARVAANWLNDTLTGEFTALYSLTQHDYALRPKLIYAFNDQVKGTIGADVFRGAENTYFGHFRGLSLAYAEVKCSF